MAEYTGTQGRRWSVGRSIAMELDVALGALSGEAPDGELPASLQELARLAPSSWRAEWGALLGPARRGVSLLGPASLLAGTLAEEDYGRATLPLREMSLPEALTRAGRLGRDMRLEPSGTLPPAPRFSDLLVRLQLASATAAGLKLTAQAARGRQMAAEAEQLVRVLQGGDLHSRFWHWLDRAYYEFYRPWRERQESRMVQMEQQALLALGGRQQTGPPETGWLPSQNPLRSHAELEQAVREGRLEVFFWVQPFGLYELFALYPGVLALSFAEPDALHGELQQVAADIAARARALGDPSRLLILRLIRHLGMDNTQMADYLGLARPTVSIHAKVLREAGLIDTRSDGRAALHGLNEQALRQLFRDLERFLDLTERGA
jgi:DNA-binding transcriptional ArsR family regulator